jgi:hypothetical protein
MSSLNLFTKIANFFKRYSTAVMLCLFVCIVAQHCTIMNLRQEVAFLHDKYENYVPFKPDSSAMGVAGADVMYQPADGEALIIKQQEAQPDNGGDSSVIWWIVVMVILLALLGVLLYRFGLLPFGVNVTGKVWQDLNGRIIYTLQIKNGSRKAVTVTNPIIEFGKMSEKRKFRMPVADFPLTLQASTKHVVNVSLQKLIEQNQSLLDYRTIRASVDCNNRVYRTFPLVVRWSK